MRQRANFPGAAQDSNLFRRFEQAHLMDDRSPVSHGGRRGQVWREPFTQLLQREAQNNLVGIRIFALRVVHHIQTIKQLKSCWLISLNASARSTPSFPARHPVP